MKVLYIIILIVTSSFISNAKAQDIDDMNSFKINFTRDTSIVEQHVRKMLDNNYTTMGMIEASAELEKGYDLLLNKYYKKLLDAVNVEDRTIVRETQRNWIKYRDSEKDLIRAINRKTYTDMGGGTIWGVISASMRADLTRKRVIEIYNYLTFDDIGG